MNGNTGFLHGDEFHWVFSGCWHEKHLLLLQLDSETDKVLWGNCGIAHFFIRPEDLKNLDFSKVVYCWAGG